MATRDAWRHCIERVTHSSGNTIWLYFLFFVLIFSFCSRASSGDLITTDASAEGVVTAECAKRMRSEQARKCHRERSFAYRAGTEVTGHEGAVEAGSPGEWGPI